MRFVQLFLLHFLGNCYSQTFTPTSIPSSFPTEEPTTSAPSTNSTTIGLTSSGSTSNPAVDNNEDQYTDKFYHGLPDKCTQCIFAATFKTNTNGKEKRIHGHNKERQLDDAQQSLDIRKTTQVNMYLYGYRYNWYEEENYRHSAYYEITNLEDTVQYYVGQLCYQNTGGSACAFVFPPGEYIWRVHGNEHSHSSAIKWEFCGKMGGVEESFIFTILQDGTCEIQPGREPSTQPTALTYTPSSQPTDLPTFSPTFFNNTSLNASGLAVLSETLSIIETLNHLDVLDAPTNATIATSNITTSSNNFTTTTTNYTVDYFDHNSSSNTNAHEEEHEDAPVLIKKLESCTQCLYSSTVLDPVSGQPKPTVGRKKKPFQHASSTQETGQEGSLLHEEWDERYENEDRRRQRSLTDSSHSSTQTSTSTSIENVEEGWNVEIQVDQYFHDVVNQDYGLYLYGNRNNWFEKDGQSSYYEVTNLENTIQFYVGQLCPGKSGGPACSIKLNSGTYLWHVSGGEYSSKEAVSWEFCGRKGGVESVLAFTIGEDGNCEIGVHDDLEGTVETSLPNSLPAVNATFNSSSNVSFATHMSSPLNDVSTLGGALDTEDLKDWDGTVHSQSDSSEGTIAASNREMASETTTSQNSGYDKENILSKFSQTAETFVPTVVPTSRPSSVPTTQPSSKPTPTRKPSRLPTTVPSRPTLAPSAVPSRAPSQNPTLQPTSPTTVPTRTPSQPTVIPTIVPTRLPSSRPSSTPTLTPTISFTPTVSPTAIPSETPTISLQPTIENTFSYEDDDEDDQCKQCIFDMNAAGAPGPLIHRLKKHHIRDIHAARRGPGDGLRRGRRRRRSRIRTGTGGITNEDGRGFGKGILEGGVGSVAGGRVAGVGTVAEDGGSGYGKGGEGLGGMGAHRGHRKLDVVTMSLFGFNNTWNYGNDNSSTWYEITDYNDSAAYFAGQLCPDQTGGSPCPIRLPAGQYVFRVYGGDGPHREDIGWEYCGTRGGAFSSLKFTVDEEGNCTPDAWEEEMDGEEVGEPDEKKDSQFYSITFYGSFTLIGTLNTVLSEISTSTLETVLTMHSMEMESDEMHHNYVAFVGVIEDSTPSGSPSQVTTVEFVLDVSWFMGQSGEPPNDGDLLTLLSDVRTRLSLSMSSGMFVAQLITRSNNQDDNTFDGITSSQLIDLELESDALSSSSSSQVNEETSMKATNVNPTKSDSFMSLLAGYDADALAYLIGLITVSAIIMITFIAVYVRHIVRLRQDPLRKANIKKIFESHTPDDVSESSNTRRARQLSRDLDFSNWSENEAVRARSLHSIPDSMSHGKIHYASELLRETPVLECI